MELKKSIKFAGEENKMIKHFCDSCGKEVDFDDFNEYEIKQISPKNDVEILFKFVLCFKCIPKMKDFFKFELKGKIV